MLKKFFATALCCISLFLVSCKEDPWVAKINGEQLTLEEFENYYYANHRPIYDASREEIDKIAQDPKEVERNPYLNRQKFLEQFIRQYLVEQMIDEEKILDNDKEFQSTKFLQDLSLVVARYAKLKFQDNLKVSPEEIEAEYNRNKEQYASQQASQVEKLITQKLMYDKYQKMSEDIVSELKNKHKITRNQSIIDKLTDSDLSNDPSEGDVFSIDDFTMTVDDFKNFYYAQHKPIYNVEAPEIDKISQNSQLVQQNPLLNRKVFLEQFIHQKLIYDEALNGEFNLKEDKDLEYFIKIQDTIVKIAYYIKKRYTAELEPSNEEIDAVYQQYKDRFQGVPANQIESYLKPRILQQKLQQKGSELIQNAKEQSVIEYNNKELMKASSKEDSDKE